MRRKGPRMALWKETALSWSLKDCEGEREKDILWGRKSISKGTAENKEYL